jgi:hypothetical protein
MSEVLKNESLNAWITRETRKLKLRDRYWADEDFRTKKNEEHKNRARQIVFCESCKNKYTYGSMGPHRKFCKGFVEPDPMVDLVESFEKLCL